MKKHHVQIDPETRDVLSRSTVTASSVQLPAQLARPVYENVNKALMAAGGKWNQSAKAHLFSEDPREVFSLALESGLIRDNKKATNAFYTPPELAARVADLADVQEGHRVLEPSAGQGALALVCRGMGGEVVCCEKDPASVEKLRALGFCTLSADFLNSRPSREFDLVDRIVMNPPFENGSDVKHILHARKFLSPSGKLVAICANGSKQRAALEPLAHEWIDLPAGSFSSSGTNVNTAIVILHAI